MATLAEGAQKVILGLNKSSSHPKLYIFFNSLIYKLDRYSRLP